MLPLLGACRSCQPEGDSSHALLCEDCFKLHAKGKFAGHIASAVSVERSVNFVLRALKLDPVLPTCQVHPGQLCGLRCTTCADQPLLCLICMPTHRSHAYSALSELASEAKRLIRCAIYQRQFLRALRLIILRLPVLSFKIPSARSHHLHIHHSLLDCARWLRRLTLL
jgi:hypothetical protein